MKKIFLKVLPLFVSAISFAQQDAQYTQYMYNTATVNPAYAGTRQALNIFGLHRSQWIGLDGAPTTNTFAINSPLGYSGLGAGLSFVNDKIGPTTTNNLAIDISYTIPISGDYDLSFGIKGAGKLFNFDANKLNYDTSDAYLMSVENDFSPNVGAGVYLHSNAAYLGVSIPAFLKSKNYKDNEHAVYLDKMHLYLIGGYVFDLSPSVQFKPAFLLKATQGAPLQLDLSGNFMFNEKFVVGASWRWSAAISAMAGFQITDGIYLGYGYDRETTNLTHYNSGSHELFLRFELLKRDRGLIAPRFF